MFRVESNSHDREPIMLTRMHITLPTDPPGSRELMGIIKTTFVSALATVMPRWP